MQSARNFLAKVLPWDMAGENVWYNLHYRGPLSEPRPGRTHFWDGRAYATLDALVGGIDFHVGLGRDVYVCMSAQNRSEEVIAKTGRPYRKAIRFQSNVVGLRSFYIDVDVKPEAYATQEEALSRFKLFIEATDLPLPTCVVGSGSGGFHAHWAVNRDLTLNEWQPIAAALAHATQQMNLICDTQCTIDAARILRIPGTKNFKSAPPKPVTLMSMGDVVDFADFCDVLSPWVGLTPIGNTPEIVAFPFPRKEPTVEGSELSKNIIIFDAPAPTREAIAEACPWFKDTLETGGADNNEPLWHTSLNVASFTEDDNITAHLVSNMHEDYNAEATEVKYEQVLRNNKERGLGWPQCHRISNLGAPQCKICPHLKANKSPINFVSAPAPAIHVGVTLPGSLISAEILPPKYTRRADGLIYASAEMSEAGQVHEKKLCGYPMSSGWLQDNPWRLHFTATTGVGKITKVSVGLAEFGGMGGARKTLGDQGMVFNDREFKAVQEFLVAWIQTLQTQRNSVVSSSPFGWSKFENSNQLEGFTYAGRVWGDNVNRPAAQTDTELMSSYSPHGDLEPWLEASRLITNQKRPALDVILASAFAGPLIYFTGHEGALLSAFSKTGVGKSTALSTALSVWGHPVRAKQGLSDTMNSLFGKLGKLKHIPVYWDELQDRDQIRRFISNVFTITGGVEKSRMSKDLELQKRGDWKTLVVSTSNYSLYEPMMAESKTHTANLMRTFEFYVEPPAAEGPGRIEVGRASRIIGNLKDNYGHAGLIYSQFLGVHHARINAELAKYHDDLNTEMKATEAERLWTMTMSIILCGARYANELGLAEIDLGAMRSFLGKTLLQLRGVVANAPSDMDNKLSVSSILASFLAATRSENTIITNRIHIGQGKPPKNSITVHNDLSHKRILAVHIGRDDKLLRFSSTFMSSWLQKNEMPRQGFMKALEEEFGFKKMNGIIGSGTPFSTGAKEYLYEIHYDDPLLQGFIEVEA